MTSTNGFVAQSDKKDKGERREQVRIADKSNDYTCPMHPEVRYKRPGACPKCGMALEGAVVVGGLSALGAGLYSIGIP